jgi:anti-sigma factor RsiW
MNCQSCIDFLHDYLTGELSAAERATFKEHLARCPECVAYLETYQETIKLGKAACRDQDPPVPEALVRAILAARPRPEGGAPPH